MEETRQHINPKSLYKNRQTVLAHLLKKLRMEKGLTQSDIANLTGFGQSDVSKLESGERSIKFVEIDFYARALGLDVGLFAKEMLEAMWESDEPPIFNSCTPQLFSSNN